jgi:hypothetical protein
VRATPCKTTVLRRHYIRVVGNKDFALRQTLCRLLM